MKALGSVKELLDIEDNPVHVGNEIGWEPETPLRVLDCREGIATTCTTPAQ